MCITNFIFTEIKNENFKILILFITKFLVNDYFLNNVKVMTELKIRKALLEDAKEILEIYKYYVENTAISFECIVPSLEEFTLRIKSTLKKYPYIVAEKNGEIVGYAYTGAFKSREAYDWSVETTIYIKHTAEKNGYGRRLYETLENLSKAQHILNMYSCIGYPEVEDEFLTYNSKEFHEHMGYKTVGLFNNCGHKFNRWYHMIWMEKIIGEHKLLPEPIIPFSEFNEEKLLKLGLKK